MAGRLSSVALGVCSELFELLFKFLQFFVGEIFQIDQFISRLLQRTNDFVELEMHRFGVAVLGVLIRNTIRKVMIVVAVLMMSCHVSEK